MDPYIREDSTDTAQHDFEGLLTEYLGHSPPWTPDELATLRVLSLKYVDKDYFDFKQFKTLTNIRTIDLTCSEIDEDHESWWPPSREIFDLSFNNSSLTQLSALMLPSPALEYINVPDTLISDLRPLVARLEHLPRLDTLDVRGCPLDEESFFDLLPWFEKKLRRVVRSTEEEWRMTRELFARGWRITLSTNHPNPLTFVTCPGVLFSDHSDGKSYDIGIEAIRKLMNDPTITSLNDFMLRARDVWRAS